MGIRTRLVAATMAAAATVTVVGGAAAATAAPASPTESATSDGKKPGNGEQPGVPEEAVKLLAAELHISVDRARQVFRDLEKVKARGDAIVSDPAFVAIAKGLGITPEQLLATLRKVKQAIAEKLTEKVQGGPATK